MVDYLVFLEQQRNVSSLGDGVAAEIDDTGRRSLKKFIGDTWVQAGTWWVDDNSFI